MKIRNKSLKKVTAVYVMLPVIIFLFEWTSWWIAIVSSVASIVALSSYIKKNKEDGSTFEISKNALICIGMIAMVYVFWSGVGKLVAQPTFYYDHIIRNSIFRDMVFADWPVQYENDIYLCYYIGHWVFPAFVGKIIAILIPNAEVSYFLANVIQYIWSVFGMAILFVWIAKILKKSSTKKVICIIIMFILYSGLDIIGKFIMDKQITMSQFIYGFKWWSVLWHYSSFTEAMYWSYNQFTFPLLIIVMLLDDKEKRNRGMFLIAGLLYAPYPIVVYGLYLLTMDLVEIIKTKSVKGLKSYFCVPNILSTIFVFPIMYFYFKANWKISEHLLEPQANIEAFNWFNYILFVLCDFLIYVILIFRKGHKNNASLIVATLYLLVVIPLFHNLPDFIMRSSMTFMFIIYLNVAEFIFDKEANLYKRIILGYLLVIAALNPFCEINRAVQETVGQGHLGSDVDEINIMTLPEYFRYNYISAEDSIFFNYLIKGK